MSVLSLERVVEGGNVGDRCKVKVRGKIHEGKVFATGTSCKLNLSFCALGSISGYIQI